MWKWVCWMTARPWRGGKWRHPTLHLQRRWSHLLEARGRDPSQGNRCVLMTRASYDKGTVGNPIQRLYNWEPVFEDNILGINTERGLWALTGSTAP